MIFTADPGVFFDYRYQHCAPDQDFDQHFAWRIKSCARDPGNWGLELLNTAQYVQENSTRPLMVALSGGLDSELICRSLHVQGIPFVAFTVQYSDYENYYDTQWAELFCQQHGIVQYVHQVSFEDLYTKRIERYIDQGYQAVNLFRYFQLFVIDTIHSMGYTAVLGSGEQKFKIKRGHLGLPFDPGFLNSLDYGRSLGVQHWPYFFMSRPELVLSYLNEPEVIAGTTGVRQADLQMSHAIKCQVYSKYFPDLAQRPKFSGMDRVHGRRLELQAGLIQRFPELRKKFIRLDQLRTDLGAS